MNNTILCKLNDNELKNVSGGFYTSSPDVHNIITKGYAKDLTEDGSELVTKKPGSQMC